MFKKVLIAGVAVVLGLMVVKNTHLGSLLRHWCDQAKTGIQNAVPIETEIAALRNDINNLDKDAETHYRAIAKEMTAVQALKKEIEHISANLEDMRQSLRIMREELKSDRNEFTIGDVKYSRKRYEGLALRTLDAIKRCEAELECKKEMLESRETSLATAETQLGSLRQARFEMEKQLVALEADFKKVKNAQIQSKFQLDDSELSKVKASLARLQERIDEQKNLLVVQGKFADKLPLANDKTPNVNATKRDPLKETDEYFNKVDGNEGKISVKKGE
jgi:chromosome segregation ATPase